MNHGAEGGHQSISQGLTHEGSRDPSEQVSGEESRQAL